MSDYITSVDETYRNESGDIYMGVRGTTGTRIFLDNPDPAAFQPDPVARSLSHIRRYAGNYSDYTVAQHACLVAEVVLRHGGIPPQVLAALHHDDGEIVTSDMPSPVKAWLRTRTDAMDFLEAKLGCAIEARYQVDLRDPLVRWADKAVFAFEVKRIVPPEARWMYEPLPDTGELFMPYNLFTPWSADEAYAKYMDIHEQLVDKIDQARVTEEFTNGAS